MQSAQLLSLIIEDKAASIILEVFTSLVYCHNYVLFLGLHHRCTNFFFNLKNIFTWLHQVLVLACRIFDLSCGMWDLVP